MTKKLREVLANTWQDIGYESCIFLFLFVKFILFMPKNFMKWVPTYYAINYSYGFIPRGFIGNIFKFITNGNISFLNAHSFAFLGTYILIILTAILFGKIIRSIKDTVNRKRVLLLTFIYFLMPFSICYLFDISNFGRLDLYLYIITFIQILMICKKQTLPRLLVCSVLSCICVMIHEGYALFIFPIFFIYLLYLLYKNKFDKKLLTGVGIVLLLTGILTVYFNFFANINIENSAECIAQLREKTDLKINEYCIEYEYYKHSFYEHANYFVEKYLNINLLALLIVLLVILLPVNFVFIRFIRNTMREEKEDIFNKITVLMLMSLLVYIPLFLATSDWGRWLASLYNSIVTIIVLMILENNSRVMNIVDLPVKKESYYSNEDISKYFLFTVIVSYIAILGEFHTAGIYNWLYSIIYNVKNIVL